MDDNKDTAVETATAHTGQTAGKETITVRNVDGELWRKVRSVAVIGKVPLGRAVEDALGLWLDVAELAMASDASLAKREAQRDARAAERRSTTAGNSDGLKAENKSDFVVDK